MRPHTCAILSTCLVSPAKLDPSNLFDKRPQSAGRKGVTACTVIYLLPTSLLRDDGRSLLLSTDGRCSGNGRSICGRNFSLIQTTTGLLYKSHAFERFLTHRRLLRAFHTLQVWIDQRKLETAHTHIEKVLTH